MILEFTVGIYIYKKNILDSIDLDVMTFVAI